MVIDGTERQKQNVTLRGTGYNSRSTLKLLSEAMEEMANSRGGSGEAARATTSHTSSESQSRSTKSCRKPKQPAAARKLTLEDIAGWFLELEELVHSTAVEQSAVERW